MAGGRGASAAIARRAAAPVGIRAVADLLPRHPRPRTVGRLTALSERRPRPSPTSSRASANTGGCTSPRCSSTIAQLCWKILVASAPAVLKGAAAANWPQVSTEDQGLVRLALQRESLLPPRQVLFARGLRDYFAGLRTRPSSGSTGNPAGSGLERGMDGVGRVDPRPPPPDGSPGLVAEVAFERARRTDSSFTPPLLHLAEIAIRRGDLEQAEQLVAGVRRADPDSAFTNQLTLMIGCIRSGPASVEWGRALRRSVQEVVAAGKLLAVGASQPDCAEAAFRAILNADSVALGERWGALQGLQALLIAIGRAGEVPSLLASKAGTGLPASLLLLLDASAGAGFEESAQNEATQLSPSITTLSPTTLWLLESWEARRGREAPLQGDRHCSARQARFLGAAPGFSAGRGSRCPPSPREG